MRLRIYTERIQRGWTAKYVGEQTGISAEAIRLIETDQRKPSYAVLVKLEDLFGMTHRELFAGAALDPQDRPSAIPEWNLESLGGDSNLQPRCTGSITALMTHKEMDK